MDYFKNIASVLYQTPSRELSMARHAIVKFSLQSHGAPDSRYSALPIVIFTLKNSPLDSVDGVMVNVVSIPEPLVLVGV